MLRNLSCRCGEPKSSAQTALAQPALPVELANPSASSRREFPERRTRPWPTTNGSLQSQTHSKLWCTGKDSNLRTSLGGTDLQSVGFNHSPTCANAQFGEPLHPAAPHCAGENKSRRQKMLTEKPGAHKTTVARSHHIWKRSLMECFGNY